MRILQVLVPEHAPACNEPNHLGLREALARKRVDVRLQILLRLGHAGGIGFAGIYASPAERDFWTSACQISGASSKTRCTVS
jgi:hypothetical protein